MADVKFEVVRFALSTASAGNTQDITISGFGTPKAAIFILSGATADDTITANSRVSIGFTDGTLQGVVAYSSTDNVGTSNTDRRQSNASVLVLAGSSVDVEFSINSFITNGVRLDIDTANASGFLCTCILIGGDDVTDAFVGHRQLGVGTGPVDITDVGFESDIVFIGSTGNQAVLPSLTVNGILSFGAGINDGSDTQRVVALSASNGSGTTNVTNYIGNDSITGQAFSGNLNWDAVIGSYDSSGFSLTPNSSAGSDEVSYLCLKFANDPDVSLFDLEWPTSGDYAETTPGFTPNFGLIVSSEGLSTRNSPANTGGFGASISAFDDAGIITADFTEKDAVATTVSKSLSADQLRILDADGVTDAVVASGFAFDSDGWDFTLSTNPGSAVLGWGLAIGTGAAATTAAITGTATASINETDIVSGGKTIIITLTGDTWVASGATFNAQRQNIIDGLDSAQSETFGWNAEVRDKEVVTAVVRTSATVVTVTLTAAAAYDITAQETITVTVPATALATSVSAVIGTPTITVATSAADLLIAQSRSISRFVPGRLFGRVN